MNKHSYRILLRYLKMLSIPVSRTKLKQLMFSHPEEGSMYAMVDVLEELQIDCAALSLDMDALQANCSPAIVHTKKDEGTFLIVEKVENRQVFYTDGYRQKTIPEEEFEHTWSKVALYVAEPDGSQAPSGRLSLPRLRIACLIIFPVVCVVLWSISVAWSLSLLLQCWSASEVCL